MHWRLTALLPVIEMTKLVLIAAHHYIRIFSSSMSFMDWRLTVSLSLIEVTKLVLIAAHHYVRIFNSWVTFHGLSAYSASAADRSDEACFHPRPDDVHRSSRLYQDL